MLTDVHTQSLKNSVRSRIIRINAGIPERLDHFLIEKMKRIVKLKNPASSKLHSWEPQCRFLDKRELAQYLGISLYTVDAWVSQKLIPFIKMGGRKVVFDRNEIEKWIDEQRVMECIV